MKNKVIMFDNEPIKYMNYMQVFYLKMLIRMIL